MSRRALHDRGRVAAFGGLPVIFALAALGAPALSCTPRTGGGGTPSDPTASASSALVTSPATWQNLWGSWPLTRYEEAAAYDSDRSILVVFGGRASANGPYYGDTWEWSSARGAWNERTPATGGPAYRADASMVYDTVRKKTFMFSGWQPAAGFYIPEQWEYDGPTATWTQRQIAGAQPAPRYGAQMVWDPDRSRAVLFGGYCYDANSDTAARGNDLWEWDGTTGTWTQRTPAGTGPTPRLWHSMVYDASRKKIVLYGGNTGTAAPAANSVDETWEWDGAAGTWTKITPTASLPYYYSYNIQLAYDASRSKVVSYLNYQYMSEYNPTTPTWTTVTATTSDGGTPAYTHGTFLYDPSRSAIIVWGGESGQPRNLYEYAGSTAIFTNRSTPVNGPAQRESPQIAYDSMSGKLILFGGYSTVDNLYKQDTFQWSGTDAKWTAMTNANAKPQGRYQGGMVYDSKRDQFLLVGGVGAASYVDVWSWSPATANWTQITFSGTPQPSSLYNFPTFYDSARDKVLVYMNYYTIWEFSPDVATWVQRAMPYATAPVALQGRYSPQVTFDPDRGKLLLVGGYSNVANVGGVYDADVWEWDTTTAVWTERPPAMGATVPSGRANAMLSYDTLRRVVMMFGGQQEITGVSSVPLNDSWEWDGVAGTWNETTPPGIKPLPRYNNAGEAFQVFDSLRPATLLFGGYAPADTTYSGQEIWEYIASSAPRANGSGCSAAGASTCQSGNCVDGVCCAQTAAQCNGTCMACNVPGKAGTCNPVPAGSPDDTCPSDQSCDANHLCKARLGNICSTYVDCASGHCADGVCCDTDCNDTCKVCNLNNSRGTCSFVSAGDEDPLTCASDADQGRYCDGSGVCTNSPKPTGKPCTASGQCASSYCIDGFCCGSPCNQTCYSCGLAASPGSCQPIAAGLPDHSATTPCDGAMQFCTGQGTCGMNKRPNGQACSASSDCGSTFCVDGYCCNSTCTGTCQSCGVAGSLGSCVNLPAGAQDTNSAPACGGTQYCDASGTCQSGLKSNGTMCAAGTECGSGHCADSVCCDSACTDACYACNLPASLGTCTGVANGGVDSPSCLAPNYCGSDHTCSTGKKPNGAACAADPECGSNICVDGTCCESTCGTACHSCANATGTCALVADGMDPRNDCRGQGICTGTCNGQGACRFGPQGTVCAAPGCQTDTGLITNGGACDGAGNCAQVVMVQCNGFGCFTDNNMMAQCKTNCATDPDCSLKRYCQTGGDGGTADGGSGSQCPAAFPTGHTCTRNAECQNNTCAIATGMTTGVCCNVACNQCGSCNTAGSVGTCVPIPAGSDPNGDCMDNASDPSGKCGGMCDGHAHCLYPLAGTTCGTCKTCNGEGLCNVPPDDDVTCGTIACSALNTSCLEYNNLTTKRCGSLGSCKTPNVAASCTDVTNLCVPDGGTGTGGKSGADGGPGTDGGPGADGGPGTDGSADGKKSGGGGGCGCDLGGATPMGAAPALLLLAGVLTRRRRRG